MASVVGLDLGNASSKIGVARRGGIDIIVNEVSNRATPSLISFTPRQRYIGEAAKTAETSNFKNTIGSLKRLIGRKFDDPEIQEIEKKFINAELVDVDGTVGVKVQYLGEPTTFSATQLVAMYLGRLRDQASAELGSAVSDVVIAVPGWFTDIQRRAMLNAAEIAGLNSLRLINDLTAVALGWGITKTDLPESTDAAKNVVFIDVGHSNFSVAVAAFSKGQLRILSSAYDRHFGGRDLDFALVQHFAKEFQTKYKIDVLSSPKAIFRLAAGCEKLKKVLSANPEAPINVESIMNDVDAASKLTRTEFEGLVSDVLSRVQAPILSALKDAGVTAEEIDSVELVGGSSRVPAIKERIAELFPGKTLGATLNQDEAIARGATFACATLSPVFKVREFAVHDINSYPIKVTWAKDDVVAPGDDDTELLVFPALNGIPSTKVLTFSRTGPFDLEASYAEPENLPGKINPWVGRASFKNIKPGPDGEPATVKVKARLNLHGILSFEGAYTTEEIEKEDTSAPVPMDTDAAPAVDGAEAAPEEPKKKKVVIKKTDVSVVSGYAGLEEKAVNEFREKEGQMGASDKLVIETEERKNALEEYVYDMRGKLEDRYAAYVQAEEKEKLLSMLQDAEDWLYTEEGEDATKSAYVAKLDTVKAVGNPVALRYTESEARPKAASALREVTNDFLQKAQSGDEKYAHIDAKDIEAVIEKNALAASWLDNNMAKQAERAKNVNPAMTSEEILKRRDEVMYFSAGILNRPKPRTTVPPKTETPPPTKEKTDGEPEAVVEEMDADELD
ncbi:heat shock protein [Phaffia rhodozyma]|uniref:Heat shock protein n=1 Tax=Phaffia rhodozyma TaxID=264483 RepID=A0A0F7SR66_PHARH|nr:heat shock protein [Phaffia rhodozyma]